LALEPLEFGGALVSTSAPSGSLGRVYNAPTKGSCLVDAALLFIDSIKFWIDNWIVDLIVAPIFMTHNELLFLTSVFGYTGNIQNLRYAIFHSIFIGSRIFSAQPSTGHG
jgi:hypothetical protein